MKKKKKKEAEPRKNKRLPNDFLDFLKTLSRTQPKIAVLDYEEMKKVLGDFILTLHLIHTEDYEPIQTELVQTAGKEVLGMLHDKYEIPFGDAAVLLLTIGMVLLNEADADYKKKSKAGGV